MPRERTGDLAYYAVGVFPHEPPPGSCPATGFTLLGTAAPILP